MTLNFGPLAKKLLVKIFRENKESGDSLKVTFYRSPLGKTFPNVIYVASSSCTFRLILEKTVEPLSKS